MITTTRIAEITALAEAATPDWCVYSEPDVGLFPSLFAGTPGQAGFRPIEPLQGADLNFAATARTAVPELLAENARLYDLAKANNALAGHNSDAFVAERAKTTALIEEREAMVARVASATEAFESIKEFADSGENFLCWKVADDALAALKEQS